MSDSYDIDGVTVSPVGGGYYDLTRSGQDPERVQGKERAEQRATEISRAASFAEGRMDDQSSQHLSGGLEGSIAKPPPVTSDAVVKGQDPDGATAASKALHRDALDKGLIEPTDEEKRARLPADTAVDEHGKPRQSDEQDMIAKLRADLAEQTAKNAELTEAAKSVATVVADQEPDDAKGPTINSVPREYAGQMDAKTKASLKRMGIGVSTIVLEENENIPPTGLFVGHNGRSYMIKPGEEVDVPDFLTEVLDNAVMAAPITDSQTQKVLGYRSRSKYPYRRVNGK